MRVRVVASGVVALVAFVPGCFSSASDCSASNTCAAPIGSTDAGHDGDGGDGGDGADRASNDKMPIDEVDPACDGKAAPSEDACTIHEHFGVFASPDGASDGTGTRRRPFASIAAAMKAAKTAGKRVYLCADRGTFAETLAIDAAVDGVRIYGGFECTTADWSYQATLRARITPSKGGAVVVVKGLVLGLTLHDVSVEAHDGTSTGESSIAMIVSNSARVALRRVTLAAANGATGSAGTVGANGANASAPGSTQQGTAATCTSAPAFHSGGAWSSPSACGSHGGPGGESLLASAGSDGESGMPNASVDPPGVANAGAGSSGMGTAGHPGAPGSSGLAGSAGAPAQASGGFSATGYAPIAGGDGSAGHVGQGGGGGGASSAAALSGCIGASGGAGGAGGCGGGAGHGGKGGGASIALVVWSSSVSLATVTLTSGSGGNGGKGGDAGYGGNGGTGADGGARLGGAIGAAGNGGAGGNGGDGGAGAGGNGGPSYALVYSGAPPVSSDGTTLAHGAGGAGGIGGALPQTTASRAPDGIEGDAATEHVP